VARELALPCIVSIPGLMEVLRDGEIVEMDGTAGTLRRVEVEG
jgi:pyruvate,water dikinase